MTITDDDSHAHSPGSLPTMALVPVTTTVLSIAPIARADDLARSLVEAALGDRPLSHRAMETWWREATAAQRVRIVLELARAISKVDAYSASRLQDPAWVAAMSTPLALARWVNKRRKQRRTSRLSANSVRAQRADWKHWRRWCKTHGRPTFNPTDEALTAFLAWFAPKRKLASVKRFGASFTAMHRAAGYPDPLSVEPLRETWLGALRVPDLTEDEENQLEQADPRRPSPGDPDRRAMGSYQAAALGFDERERMLAACNDGTLLGLRDAAIVACAYDMMARRSEIGALRLRDLKRKPDGTGRLLISRSKTDQEGKGFEVFVRADTLQRIDAWLEAARIGDQPSGRLFRSLRGFAARGRAGILPPLPADAVSTTLRRRARLAKLSNAEAISGHSGRVGKAVELAKRRVPDSQIANLGRWKRPDMVMVYTRGIRADQSEAAILAREQVSMVPIGELETRTTPSDIDPSGDATSRPHEKTVIDVDAK